MAPHHDPANAPRPRSSTCCVRCFSIVELLVVISIIVVLVGILLVALSRAREAGRRTRTLATMTAFASACESFAMEHGFYPGLVPEHMLAFHNHQIVHGEQGYAISGMENALLHLMGGYVVEGAVPASEYAALSAGWIEFEIISPTGTPMRFKVNREKMGEGPRIDGKQYGGYFHPGGSDLVIADDQIGQWKSPPEAPGAGGGGDDRSSFSPPSSPSPPSPPPHRAAAGGTGRLPDLLDAWGTPIIYWRQARESGPLVSNAHDYNFQKPRFYEDSNWAYTRSAAQQWFDPCSAGADGRPSAGSLLHTQYFNSEGGGVDNGMSRRLLAQVLRGGPPVADPMDAAPGSPRGAFVLISAGPDGIYFAADDGPGSPDHVIASSGCGGIEAFPFDELLACTPACLAQFDDMIQAGGSFH